MRIIKPYGRSHVEKDEDAKSRRLLLLRPTFTEKRGIEDFTRSHAELVIAQWISTIDKIATKPSRKNGPTEEQRTLRQLLGEAAWNLLAERRLITADVDQEHLAKLWKVKIHPYGNEIYKARQDRKGREFPPPSPKGRWYKSFIGDVEIAKVDGTVVAQRIYEHLYEREYRINADSPPKRQGRIESRARSIAQNVPRPPKRLSNKERAWSDRDKNSYMAAGDVAGEIRAAAIEKEGHRRGGKRPSNFVLRDAAPFLHAQYGRLFRDETGRILPIAEAREAFSGMFALHGAIREAYARILKHHRKSSVARVLPHNMPALFGLLEAKLDNRDLAALVRLGKIIHYESGSAGPDSPSNLVENWPTDIAGSAFWTSDGQARIKRNEAFVRVWRHALALAARTLTDWADPDGRENDILLANPIKSVTGERFARNNYNRKIDLLFGNRSKLLKSGDDEAFEKNVLKAVLCGIAHLRHGSFHFKGIGGFSDALITDSPDVDPKVHTSINRLWETDLRDRAEQLRKTMRGAHFDYFLDMDRNRALFATLSGTTPAAIPLPRFRRILNRAENAWSREKSPLQLPAPANRAALENPARLCQYTALKLLYERPFRAWLETRTTAILNAFIGRAIERATQAARNLNARNDEDRREVIVARAAVIGRLADNESLLDFFFNLSAETASEMRVQRGYYSDSDSAREQAGYIEDLKCDVVALAFSDYLEESGFGFLLELSPDTPKPDAPACDLGEMIPPEIDTRAEDWQKRLYFLVHLVPVDDIGRLLHQMRKWELLAKDTEPSDKEMVGATRRIQMVLELYLDMHDAKFEGGTALIGTEPFSKLFETPEAFARIFPARSDADDDDRLPVRGLREIMRFGHLSALQHPFGKYPVRTEEVEACLCAEQAEKDGKSKIARLQERREALHEKWTREKQRFSGGDRRSYVESLAGVVRHRHLVAHATLINHVRLHRLLMAVLGRLVDFSGLWERDLYFSTLTLIHENGWRPDMVFTDEGLKLLGNGQIVETLRNLRKAAEADRIKDGLFRHFGAVWERGNHSVRLRNGFAHFNMLRSQGGVIDLTACVNDARDLMAYDRKLRNAVSQSVKELLRREGLDLEWTMGADHRLGLSTLASRQAPHLGEIRLSEKRRPDAGDRPQRPMPIVENLHGDLYVEMAATLFGRCAVRRRRSVVDIPLDEINWNPPKQGGRGGKNRRKPRPQDGKRHGNRHPKRK